MHKGARVHSLAWRRWCSSSPDAQPRPCLAVLPATTKSAASAIRSLHWLGNFNREEPAEIVQGRLRRVVLGCQVQAETWQFCGLWKLSCARLLFPMQPDLLIFMNVQKPAGWGGVASLLLLNVARWAFVARAPEVPRQPGTATWGWRSGARFLGSALAPLLKRHAQPKPLPSNSKKKARPRNCPASKEMLK